MPSLRPNQHPNQRRSQCASLRLAALAVATMALAACDPPLEGSSRTEYLTVVQDGMSYDAIAKYDGFQQAYFARIMPQMPSQPALTREEAIALVETGLGPQLCGGGPMVFDETGVISLFGYGNEADPLPSMGGWQIVASCA